jgi:hypothetical protein
MRQTFAAAIPRAIASDILVMSTSLLVLNEGNTPQGEEADGRKSAVFWGRSNSPRGDQTGRQTRNRRMQGKQHDLAKHRPKKGLIHTSPGCWRQSRVGQSFVAKSEK